MKLTIGMAVYDDAIQAQHTIQALRLYHILPDKLDAQILVVDNHPGGHGASEMLRLFCEGWSTPESPIRYVAMPDPVGTSPARNRVFEEAKGEIVLCIDPHVQIAPGGLLSIVRHFDVRRFDKQAERYIENDKDFVQGAILWDNLAVGASHFEPIWGEDGMYGKWALDDRCLPGALSEPFDIPGMGLGLFACRREAFLGFHPDARGFGGEELCYHEKHRRAGGRTLCLPWLRWWHRFANPRYERLAYPASQAQKARNYVLWFESLGWDVDEVRKAFVPGLLSEDEWLIVRYDQPNRRWLDSDGRTVTQTTSQPPREIGYGCGTRPLDDHVARLHSPSRLVRLKEKDNVLASILSAPQTHQYTEVVRNSAPDDDGIRNTAPLPEVDTIIIELRPPTCHVLEGLLPIYATSARKFIGVWDTANPTPDSVAKGEPTCLGLPLLEFCKANPEWTMMFYSGDEGGLTFLGKNYKRPVPEGPGFGPGTELKKLLESLGLPPCEECTGRSVQMDLWGVAGCREHRDVIVGWLKESAQALGWKDTVRTIWGRIRAGWPTTTPVYGDTGLAPTIRELMRFNVLDPYGSLVDCAIARAE